MGAEGSLAGTVLVLADYQKVGFAIVSTVGFSPQKKGWAEYTSFFRGRGATKRKTMLTNRCLYFAEGNFANENPPTHRSGTYNSWRPTRHSGCQVSAAYEPKLLCGVKLNSGLAKPKITKLLLKFSSTPA